MSEKVDHVSEAEKLLKPCNPLGDPDNGLATGACAHALLAIVEELRGLRGDLARRGFTSADVARLAGGLNTGKETP